MYLCVLLFLCNISWIFLVRSDKLVSSPTSHARDGLNSQGCKVEMRFKGIENKNIVVNSC